MCGIGGVYGGVDNRVLIESFLETIHESQKHRGPDAKEVWFSQDGRIGMCHQRLAIIGIDSTGNQPMKSTDERYVIVFNGEIYNYQELKHLLESEGVKFRTNTDTEVILEGYRRWGHEVTNYLRGMFAFAIFDNKTSELFCARDRLGKKPFIYALINDAFVFASEIPSIVGYPGIAKELDVDAISSMLLHNMRHIPDPCTAYKNIKRLRAGHAMTVVNGRVDNIWRYWTPSPYRGECSSKVLRKLLDESVKRRMRADVPVGALLSGGVDSSAIVALMQKYSTKPINTYALGFDENDEDLKRARIMANALGTNHKEFYFNPQEQWDMFNELMRIYGEPIMLLPLIHTYALCKAIRDDGVKVVLSGNGADELFYGYLGHVRTYKVSKFMDMTRAIRSFIPPALAGRYKWAVSPDGERKSAFYSTLEKRTWGRCISNDRVIVNEAVKEMKYWGRLCPSTHFIDESNFVGLMVENTHSVTTAGDLPAMAASVEIRSPFLDEEIVDFALGTPAEMKIPDTNRHNYLKAILRDAVEDLVPSELLYADKRGFGSGIQEDGVMKGAWSPKLDNVFTHINDMGGVFDAQKMKKCYEEFVMTSRTPSFVAKLFGIQVWLNQISK